MPNEANSADALQERDSGLMQETGVGSFPCVCMEARLIWVRYHKDKE